MQVAVTDNQHRVARTLLPVAQCESYPSEGGEPGSVDHASRFRVREAPVDRQPRGVPAEPKRHHLLQP